MIARRICMWGSECLLRCVCVCVWVWGISKRQLLLLLLVNVIVGSMKRANIMGYFYQWPKWAYAKDLRAVDNTLVQPICATHTHTHTHTTWDAAAAAAVAWRWLSGSDSCVNSTSQVPFGFCCCCYAAILTPRLVTCEPSPSAGRVFILLCVLQLVHLCD